MPFIAVDPIDNRPRIPIGVDDDEEVQCPVCNDSLRVREGPLLLGISTIRQTTLALVNLLCISG